MQRTPVSNSSQIKSVGYTAATQKLQIEFTNNKLYEYSEVPQAEHDKLMQAESPGKHFNAFIKGKYDYTQIKNDEAPAT